MDENISPHLPDRKSKRLKRRATAKWGCLRWAIYIVLMPLFCRGKPMWKNTIVLVTMGHFPRLDMTRRVEFVVYWDIYTHPSQEAKLYWLLPAEQEWQISSTHMANMLLIKFTVLLTLHVLSKCMTKWVTCFIEVLIFQNIWVICRPTSKTVHKLLISYKYV